MATTFLQPQVRTPGLARAHVSKETTEYGVFEVLMVTKYLGVWWGGLIIALISIYPTPELLCGEYISGGMLRYLGCLGLLIRDHSESVFAFFLNTNLGNFNLF